MNKIHVQNCSIWGGNLARAMERSEGGKAKGRQPKKAYDAFSPHHADSSGLAVTHSWKSLSSNLSTAAPSVCLKALLPRLCARDTRMWPCAHVYTCYRRAWMCCMPAWICMYTSICFLLTRKFWETGGRATTCSFPRAPHTSLPCRTVLEWSPKTSPDTMSQCQECQTWALAGVFSSEEGNFFFFLITGPPRETTSCKLLGQRELVPNLNQGAPCARVPFRREESTEIKPLPGGRAVHQAHRAEWLTWVWGETGLQPALKRPWAPWVVSMEGIWNLALEWNLPTLS